MRPEALGGAAAADAPPPASPDAGAPAAPVRKSQKRILAAVAAVAVLWWIGLVLMAIFTANPVTINREQILRSRAVVSAEVKDAASGVVEVEKEWKSGGAGRTMAVDNLVEAGARNGRRYILPLEPSDGRWRVTRSRLPNEAPLIYPASAEAEAQLARLLSDGPQAFTR